MIIYVDFVKQFQRVPYTLRRLERLQEAIDKPIALYLSNREVGEPTENAIRIGGPDADYGIKARARGLLPDAVKAMATARRGDIFICRGAGSARRLRGTGAIVPNCLRVLYVHDDPFPNSVAANDAAIDWLKPHIIFSHQPGRVEHYKRKARWAGWAYCGVNVDLFYPRKREMTYDVSIGSHVYTKIYRKRFEWMEELGKKCYARIADRLSYAEYVEMLSTSHICVDIPNVRQMGKGGDWAWMVNYRAFEIAALGRPNLLPDLPGYRQAFNDIAFFYKPNYGAFEKSVMKLLKRPKARDIRIEAGLKAVRERFSMEAVTKREANVIRVTQSSRG